MDRNKLALLFHTIKFLKPKQVYYRLLYFLRNKFFIKRYNSSPLLDSPNIIWDGDISNHTTYINGNIFQFLNLTKDFGGEVDWNFDDFGKLWTYNLNYFDFLNQKKINKENALDLIESFIESDKALIDGLESYPISLRGINWIKFLSKNNIVSPRIDNKLFNHYERLKDNLEYHILGNHLLENGYSLLFGAYYFKHEEFYKIAHKILTSELEEQILDDGAHFELSPMYHQILLHRLLDCLNLIKLNSWKTDDLYDFLMNNAKKMLGWLETITYQNGSIPMVNDSTYEIAPKSKQLFKYAKSLKISHNSTTLNKSGYRKFLGNNYELFIDVGNVGPDYQPGHAHSDTFSFEMYFDKQPFIVDVGISTYEKNIKRQNERQTFSHNTVMVNGLDQSQVWGGFRVAKRAKVFNIKEDVDIISATHDGYKSIGVFHERSFNVKNDIKIHDRIVGKRNVKIKSEAFFHIHPSIRNIVIENNQIFFGKINASLKFEGNVINITLEDYEYCLGYNKTRTGQKICVSFSENLSTTILI